MSKETGKAKVRRFLIGPLLAGGMSKSPSQSKEEHAAMLDRITRKLAYLPETQLNGLAEFCVRSARGKSHDIWPKEQRVMNWAYRMQPPPADWCDYVNSILTSVMGRRALDAGYHVELLKVASDWGPPPSKYDIRQLQSQAQSNRDKQARVEREKSWGNASADDLRWLRWYLALEAQCLAIMEPEKSGADE